MIVPFKKAVHEEILAAFGSGFGLAFRVRFQPIAVVPKKAHLSHMGPFRRTAVIILMTAGLLTVSGCTISYDVEVLLRDGRLTFDMSHSRWIFGRDDACIEELTVREVSERQQIAWQLNAPEAKCPDVRYLPYGVTPPGLATTGPATKLRAGQLYTVTLRASGGWGSRTFVMLPKNHEVYGRVATLP